MVSGVSHRAFIPFAVICALLTLIVVPFGRFMAIRTDLLEATRLEAEGGTGVGSKFWKWTEEQIQQYL